MIFSPIWPRTITELAKAIKAGAADPHDYGLDDSGAISVGPVESDGTRKVRQANAL